MHWHTVCVCVCLKHHLNSFRKLKIWKQNSIKFCGWFNENLFNLCRICAPWKLHSHLFSLSLLLSPKRAIVDFISQFCVECLNLSIFLQLNLIQISEKGKRICADLRHGIPALEQFTAITDHKAFCVCVSSCICNVHENAESHKKHVDNLWDAVQSQLCTNATCVSSSSSLSSMVDMVWKYLQQYNHVRNKFGFALSKPNSHFFFRYFFSKFYYRVCVCKCMLIRKWYLSFCLSVTEISTPNDFKLSHSIYVTRKRKCLSNFALFTVKAKKSIVFEQKVRIC